MPETPTKNFSFVFIHYRWARKKSNENRTEIALVSQQNRIRSSMRIFRLTRLTTFECLSNLRNHHIFPNHSICLHYTIMMMVEKLPNSKTLHNGCLQILIQSYFKFFSINVRGAKVEFAYCLTVYVCFVKHSTFIQLM